jgi:hypothetical protein
MKDAWRAKVGTIAPDAVAIAALFGVNALARLIVRLTGSDTDTQFMIGVWSLGAMAVAAAGASCYWAIRHLMSRVVADGLIVVTITSLLVTLIGPLVSGRSPFSEYVFMDALSIFMLQLVICLGVLGFGIVLGVLIAMAIGLDPKSRAWKAQADRMRAASRQRQRRAARR